MNNNKRPPNYRQSIKRCKNCKFVSCEVRHTEVLNVFKPMCNYDEDNIFETHWDCICDVYEPMAYYAKQEDEISEDK